MVTLFYFRSEKSKKQQRGSNSGLLRDRPTLYALSYWLKHTNFPKISLLQTQNLILQRFEKYCKILQIYFCYLLSIPKILEKYLKGLFHQIIVTAPTRFYIFLVNIWLPKLFIFYTKLELTVSPKGSQQQDHFTFVMRQRVKSSVWSWKIFLCQG